MDWNAYRVFLAVAENGSHSKAAKALDTSQPTVSRSIASLETELGVRLFVSSGRGLVPGPSGEAMLDHVRRMASAAKDVERRARGGETSLDGVVRISATEGIGAMWLTHRIEPLRRMHPGVRIELVLDNASVDLASRAAD